MLYVVFVNMIRLFGLIYFVPIAPASMVPNYGFSVIAVLTIFIYCLAERFAENTEQFVANILFSAAFNV